jgi:hypothetical protein
MPNSKARDLASLLSGSGTGTIAPALVSDQDNTSTGYFDLPSGTTAERPSNPTTGYIRHNTTFDLAEYYDGNQWKSIDSPPQVTSVSPTSAPQGNQEVTINGSNFQSGLNVKFIGADNTEYSSPAVTFVSASQATAETPANGLPANNEPYKVKVINANGLGGESGAILDAGGVPAWTTPSGSLGNLYDIERGHKTFTVVANDPDGQTVTYSLVGDSLPNGMSLNTSTGVISGTADAVGSDVTTSFTIRAETPNGDFADRSFSIARKSPRSQTFNYTGSVQNWSLPGDMEYVSVYAWGAAGGGGTAGGWSDGAPAGAGGAAEGLLDVSGLSTLAVVVGQGGNGAPGQNISHPATIFGGGGTKTDANDNRYGGTGGGLSGVFIGSFTHANSLLIAGGGGGGGSSRTSGNQSSGGAGGGTTGQDGSSYNAGRHGYGGSQTSGGGGGVGAGASGTAGSALQGGIPANGTNFYGGGGGGGYYGGGGGAYEEEQNMGGGGGGSGYLHPTRAVSGTLYAGDRTTTGNASNPWRPTNAGTASTSDGQDGWNGAVVVVY